MEPEINTPVDGASEEPKTAGMSAAEIKAQIETTPIIDKADEGTKEPEPSSAEPTDGEEPVQEIKEPETEKLLAGKFKTTEDLEKGYLEAQKALTKKSQAVKSSKEIANDLFGTEPQKETTLPLINTDEITEDEAQEYINTLIEEKVKQQFSSLQGQVTPVIAELEIEREKAANPDFMDLLPSIKEAYEEFPEFKKPGYLARIIKIARANFMPQVVQTAKEEGAQSAIAKLEEQKAAQTESAKGSTKRVDKTTLTENQIAKMSSEEIKQFLQKN